MEKTVKGLCTHLAHSQADYRQPWPVCYRNTLRPDIRQADARLSERSNVIPLRCGADPARDEIFVTGGEKPVALPIRR